ncbi:MAG TPA: lipoprotein [Xanthobacteraceae bacterium]|nr:lipoprotein [Xanthobacteraceae bacterium]
MAGYRLSFGFLLVAAAALALAGCGRKGDLELPPGPATQPPVAAGPLSPSSFLPAYGTPGAPTTQQQEDAAAVKSGFDSHGNPVAGPGVKKSFILDPILQ